MIPPSYCAGSKSCCGERAVLVRGINEALKRTSARPLKGACSEATGGIAKVLRHMLNCKLAVHLAWNSVQAELATLPMTFHNGVDNVAMRTLGHKPQPSKSKIRVRQRSFLEH